MYTPEYALLSFHVPQSNHIDKIKTQNHGLCLVHVKKNSMQSKQHRNIAHK